MKPEREAGMFDEWADSMGFRAHGKSREYFAAKAAWETALQKGAEAQRERDGVGNILDHWDGMANDTKDNLMELETGFCQAIERLRSAPIEGVAEERGNERRDHRINANHCGFGDWPNCELRKATMKPEREAGTLREQLLDKYAYMATDWADGATQINFHDFHGADAWQDVFVNVRKAMALLYDLAERAGVEAQREPLQKIAEMNCVDKWEGCDNEDHAIDCPVLAARMAIARSAPIEGEP